MPEFCDVAVPVPLDMVFTYRVPADATARRRRTRAGSVSAAAHDRHRRRTARPRTFRYHEEYSQRARHHAVLDEQLLHLGRWIADYYLAPLGEVFRTMLPLNAEFKRSIGYRLTEEGQMALHQAGIVRILRAFAPHSRGASRRVPRPRLSGWK